MPHPSWRIWDLLPNTAAYWDGPYPTIVLTLGRWAMTYQGAPYRPSVPGSRATDCSQAISTSSSLASPLRAVQWRQITTAARPLVGVRVVDSARRSVVVSIEAFNALYALEHTQNASMNGFPPFESFQDPNWDLASGDWMAPDENASCTPPPAYEAYYWPRSRTPPSPYRE